MSSEDNDSDSDTTSVFSYQITRSELDEAIKALPLNKAPSYDNITYEHIISNKKETSVFHGPVSFDPAKISAQK